jgi:hypothetical protein
MNLRIREALMLKAKDNNILLKANCGWCIVQKVYEDRKLIMMNDKVSQNFLQNLKMN